MDIYMPMATTDRHNDMVSKLIHDVMGLKIRNEVRARQSDCALVYWGTKKEPVLTEMINILDIKDTENFKESVINELEYVQPDFLLFRNNPYIVNSKRTKTAGYPDLIIEIWSDSNSDTEKEFKKHLYSTSEKTEHWYITQTSNEVECYLGSVRTENQNLANILVTRGGLEFDLRYLAV